VSFKTLHDGKVKSRRLADRSMSVGRQPEKPGWLATVVNVTGGKESVGMSHLSRVAGSCSAC